MSILTAEHLKYIYNEGLPTEKIAVNDISFTVENGDFIGIIGHTGSGKSTLVQHFNGLLKPTSGRVLFDGKDIWQNKTRIRDYRFKVGLVFQYPEYQLFEETVEKDISFGPKNMGLSDDEIHRRVLDSLEFVGLDRSILGQSPFELSGGQKRRVAIAGVLAMEPQVLILDEPAAGLDPKGRADIFAQIREYHAARNAAILVVSHSMEDIAHYAEKVMVINNGELFMFDETAKVFAQSEKLEQMGLSIPMITRVMLRLKERGFDVDTSAFTTEDAARSILSLIGRRGNDA